MRAAATSDCYPEQGARCAADFATKNKKLIEAHIIPRCQLQPLNSPSGPMVLVGKDTYAKRLQMGQYDNKILCADCDNKYASWEDDTADLLVKADAYDRFQQARPGENFYTIQDYDYASLKLCLLSILWKMSVSDRDVFKEVRLGKFEATIRRMLLERIEVARMSSPWPFVVLSVSSTPVRLDQLDRSKIRESTPMSSGYLAT